MLPAAQVVRLAAAKRDDALALLDSPDDGKALRILDGREQLEVLAEAEIVQLARHQEEAEKAEHPLNRIIAIDEQDDGIVITTTDIHLPRRIGEALKRAYRGELKLAYEEDGYFVRANWHQDR